MRFLLINYRIYVQNIVHNNKMGSKAATQWKPPADLYIVMDYKYCRVWVRKFDKVEHLEQYQINVQNEAELDQYRNMFIMRMDQSYFPRALYFMSGASRPLCSDLKTGSILIQRIAYRLCQFTNILYQEAISMLFICFKGYQILYKKYGIFKIKSTMIGLDSAYQLKMWHHTDLSSPYPEDPYCHTVYEMICSLVRAIENISACPYNMPRFSQFLEINKISLLGFQLALIQIQKYAAEYEIKIQNRFLFIQKYLKEAEGVSPLSRRIFHSKSSDKLEVSQGSRAKNRSLNKFSFKNNQVIEIQPSKFSQFLSPNIYYNNESSKSSDYHILMPIPVDQPKLKVYQPPRTPVFQSSPVKAYQQHVKLYQPEKSQKTSNFDDYGLTLLHKKNSTEGQQFYRTQKQLNKVNHFRTISDQTAMNPKPVYTKPNTPYIESTETREGEGSSSRKTFKTLISAQSYSFVVDDESKNQFTNLLRNKNHK